MPDKPYLLMINYGTEGWSIDSRYDTAEEALKHGMEYDTNHFMVLREIKFVNSGDDK